VVSQSAQVYEFGDYQLDPAQRLLRARNGAPVSLSPKAFDTLAYLVQHAGTVLPKDELIRAIWPDTAVEENNLNQNISLLRRALGEGRGGQRYISTVPGRGFQFIAAVRIAVVAMEREAAEEPAIAVLPFVNVSDDPEYEFFGDGLAEELINALSKLDQMRVVARTSAFSFKGKRTDIRNIAERLGVRFVLEGSVRKSGKRLRVTAQLVNAADGCHLWSERYDREMDIGDIFQVQDEITLAVMNALKLKLPGQGRLPVLKRHTENIRARELYLKGRFHLFRMSPSGIKAGTAYFQEAIQADPSDAHAHIGLAHAYRMFALSLEMVPGEVLPKAVATAKRAIELDGNVAEAHAVLGFNIFWSDWNWKAAEKQFHRALQLNPNSADTHWMYAHLLSNTGHHADALAEVAHARQLDPLSGLIAAMEGQFLLHASQTDEAMARLREALELDANSRVAHAFAASAYIEKGLLGEAAVEAGAARALSPGNAGAMALEAYAEARLGRRDNAQAIFDELLQLSEKRHVPPYHIAVVCQGLDDSGEALNWLERGFEQRDPRMVFVKVDPKWKTLCDDLAYVSLLRRMNLLA